jgi:hypothetical protein
MSEKLPYRSFTTAFKEAVVLRISKGDNVMPLARELGVPRKLLYNWHKALDCKAEVVCDESDNLHCSKLRIEYRKRNNFVIMLQLPSTLQVFDFYEDKIGPASGIAKCLLLKPANDFSAFAVVPKGISIERATDFSRGGVCSIVESTGWLSERTLQLAGKNKSGLFVAQDIWANLEFHLPFKKQSKSKAFGFSSSTYYWLNASEIAQENLEYTTRVTSFECICAFSSYDISQCPPPNYEPIQETLFNSILEGIQEFYIRAFDQESFIVLQKRT